MISSEPIRRAGCPDVRVLSVIAGQKELMTEIRAVQDNIVGK